MIDLQGLTKSALVARLARLASNGKRYAMANRTDGSGYEAPTRWVADVAMTLPPHMHAVQRGRELVSRVLGYSLPIDVMYGLNYPSNVPASQSIQAQAARKSIAFVHGTSRPDKEWPFAHWVDLGQRVAASGYQVKLVHGNAKELATSQAIAARLGGNAVVLPQLALDALTQEMAQCSGTIGVDSGVSHIAVALGLPHVQIYNFDTAWRTGPVGCSHQVSVFAQAAPSVDAVWQAWLLCEKGLESGAS